MSRNNQNNQQEANKAAEELAAKEAELAEKEKQIAAAKKEAEEIEAKNAHKIRIAKEDSARKKLKPLIKDEWYIVINAKKIIKKTRIANGNVYSRYICKVKGNEEFLKSLREKELVRG